MPLHVYKLRRCVRFYLRNHQEWKKQKKKWKRQNLKEEKKRSERGVKETGIFLGQCLDFSPKARIMMCDVFMLPEILLYFSQPTITLWIFSFRPCIKWCNRVWPLGGATTQTIGLWRLCFLLSWTSLVKRCWAGESLQGHGDVAPFTNSTVFGCGEKIVPKLLRW